MGYYKSEKFIRVYEKNPEDYNKLIASLDTVINKILKKSYKRVVGHMGRDDVAQAIRIHLWRKVMLKGYLNNKSSEEAFKYCSIVIRTEAFRQRKKMRGEIQNSIQQVSCAGANHNLFGVSASVGAMDLINTLYDACDKVHHGRRVLDYLTDPDSKYASNRYAGLQGNKYYSVVKKIKEIIKDVAHGKEQVEGKQVGTIIKRKKAVPKG